MKSPERKSPAECPVCGEPVPRGARACPHCGADERSGWDEDETRYDGIDLPAEAFADDSSPKTQGRRKLPPVFWWITALAVTLAFTYLVLRGRF